MPADPTYLDLRGLKCPLSVLRTRKLLSKLGRGAVAIIECADPLAVINIPHFLPATGDMPEHIEHRDDAHIFHIPRKAESASRDQPEIVPP